MTGVPFHRRPNAGASTWAASAAICFMLGCRSGTSKWAFALAATANWDVMVAMLLSSLDAASLPAVCLSSVPALSASLLDWNSVLALVLGGWFCLPLAVLVGAASGHVL